MQSGRRGMEVVVVVTSTVVYAYGRGWIPTSYLQELCSSKEYDSNWYSFNNMSITSEVGGIKKRDVDSYILRVLYVY